MKGFQPKNEKSLFPKRGVFRAVTVLAKTAKQFEATKVELVGEGLRVECTDMLRLMTIGAEQGADRGGRPDRGRDHGRQPVGLAALPAVADDRCFVDRLGERLQRDRGGRAQ